MMKQIKKLVTGVLKDEPPLTRFGFLVGSPLIIAGLVAAFVGLLPAYFADKIQGRVE